MNHFISKWWLIPFAIVATVIVLQFIDARRKSRRQVSSTTPSLRRPLLLAALLGFTIGALITPLLSEEDLLIIVIALILLSIVFSWWVALSQGLKLTPPTHRLFPFRNSMSGLAALKPPPLSLALLIVLFCAGVFPRGFCCLSIAKGLAA